MVIVRNIAGFYVTLNAVFGEFTLRFHRATASGRLMDMNVVARAGLCTLDQLQIMTEAPTSSFFARFTVDKSFFTPLMLH